MGRLIRFTDRAAPSVVLGKLEKWELDIIRTKVVSLSNWIRFHTGCEFSDIRGFLHYMIDECVR